MAAAFAFVSTTATPPLAEAVGKSGWVVVPGAIETEVVTVVGVAVPEPDPLAPRYAVAMVGSNAKATPADTAAMRILDRRIVSPDRRVAKRQGCALPLRAVLR